jgi:serine/threonine protein kinase
METLRAGDPPYVGVYRLMGRLGAGGMGRVYLGVSPGGRKVAVKLLLPEHSADTDFRRRFAREVAAARQVGGFHTAPVVDADPDADPPWMVTAYIPGPSLDAVVRNAGPLDPPALRALGAGLAEGLAAVHATGLVHRDLKPSNVIMAEDGPRIIDFGIALSLDATALTSSGVLIGTFSFMSPEQVRGERLGPETDVFSLGSVLAYAATGHGPFDSTTIPAIIHRIATEPPDLGLLSGPLRDAISACLAKNPADRPPLAYLLQFLSDVPGQREYPGQPLVPAPPRVTSPGASFPPAQTSQSAGQRGAPTQSGGQGGTRGYPTDEAWPANTPDPAVRSAVGNSVKFPARAVAVVGVAFVAVVATVLGLVLSNHLIGSPTVSGSPTVTARPAVTGSATVAARATVTGSPTVTASPHDSASSTFAPPAAGGGSTPGPATGFTVCTMPAIGCTGDNASALSTEPTSITVSADGSAYLKDLTWSGWGAATAVGAGVLEADNCDPNCAQGSDTPYDATVTLSRLAPYGDGQQAYSVMTTNVPGAPSRSETFTVDLVP